MASSCRPRLLTGGDPGWGVRPSPAEMPTAATSRPRCATACFRLRCMHALGRRRHAAALGSTPAWTEWPSPGSPCALVGPWEGDWRVEEPGKPELRAIRLLDQSAESLTVGTRPGCCSTLTITGKCSSDDRVLEPLTFTGIGLQGEARPRSPGLVHGGAEANTLAKDSGDGRWPAAVQ